MDCVRSGRPMMLKDRRGGREVRTRFEMAGILSTLLWHVVGGMMERTIDGLELFIKKKKTWNERSQHNRGGIGILAPCHTEHFYCCE